ncbi:tRNA (adenosine(37)-N6)-dimethylallyltransferase MiaA [Parasphingorhabdus flavimaris]|uniref:tRNA dimethylallyltransferase n=1 Tax=Parasphingorhabdus flavimaris TaxID=266812 RepID=A0ABX2N217_9SPHN|nr:tRNA (adenosine(37)-N6)-dimethylallyltransferase MiaA [Parasphingorhabdus flavimaris]NVD27741.1 tRNA (adenosine(37)-N6)-dimethylallyltransferase MiaA [Parasphingorhabdus flavimaris]
MNMISPKLDKNVALIVGPTASGKSALALEIAKKQPSVIINADSAQVYRDLRILSARPSDDEMDGIEHQLFGYIDGSEACSAARWADDAKTAIAAAHDRDRLPILVGGTGMYVRVLLDGIAPIPEIVPEIRATIRKMELLEAYRALAELDPVSASRLHPTDTTRIQRALEVVRSTGKPLDHWHQQKTGGIAGEIRLHPLILLPPREWLYQRCDLRLHQMIEEGAAEEVETLLSRNLPAEQPVMRAIGVPDISGWLTGDLTEETAVERAQAATRQYAKRQYTWFRNQCPAEWPRIEEPLNNHFDDIIETLLRN